MKIQALALSALTLLPITGCLDQDGLETDEDLETSVAESAICVYSTVAPPTADDTASAPHTFQVSTYGSATCRDLVLGVTDATEIEAKVHYTGWAPTYSATTCDDVEIKATVWTYDGGVWTRYGTLTDAGNWTGFSCQLPTVTYESPTHYIEFMGQQLPVRVVHEEIRVVVTTESQTSDELPVRLIGDDSI